MKRNQNYHTKDSALTRRHAFVLAGPVLLLGALDGAARCEAKDPPLDLDNTKEIEKKYTITEQLFFGQIIFPAGDAPTKTGEASNSAYCHWLIGRLSPRTTARLRLIQDLTTFSDRYPKGTPLGVINSTQVVDPNNRLFDSSTAIVRVRSREGKPRVLLRASVEERTKADGDDVAVVYYVTKKFLYSDRTWNLIESHFFQVG